jgi:hypothetical protein
MVLATMAPVGAVDPPDVRVEISMPDGSVHVVDTVFDINVIRTPDGVELEIFLTNGAKIRGFPGFAMFVETPAGDGGICNICL